MGMKLYHASTFCVEKPDVSHSRDKLDFGRGFYMTTVREQAVRYAERFTRRGKEAFINEYELDEETPDFTTKSGGVANDKVFNTVDLYFAGVITKEEALGRLKFEEPNHQLCILNNEMLDRHLHFIKAKKV